MVSISFEYIVNKLYKKKTFLWIKKLIAIYNENTLIYNEHI